MDDLVRVLQCDNRDKRVADLNKFNSTHISISTTDSDLDKIEGKFREILTNSRL